MTVKLRVLSVISAVAFLCSLACFSGYAVSLNEHYSGDEGEEPIVVDPGVVEPEPEPIYSEPTVDPEPVYSEPIVDPEPTYSEPTVDPEPSYSEQDPNSELPSYTFSELISDGNFPTADPSSEISQTGNFYESYYNPYTQTYGAFYDDNYVYIPSYTEPEVSLIETSSKQVNSDELTAEDWATIMLDIEKGNMTADGTKTFDFIKDNKEQGDTSIAWMLYLGFGLILSAVFIIIYVIISSGKAAKKYAA